MGDFTIEKGIPVPPRGRTGITSVLREMEVGDSVFIPGVKRMSMIGGITTSLRPRRFVSRSVDGGLRIWRAE